MMPEHDSAPDEAAASDENTPAQAGQARRGWSLLLIVLMLVVIALALLLATRAAPLPMPTLKPPWLV